VNRGFERLMARGVGRIVSFGAWSEYGEGGEVPLTNLF